MCRLPKWKKVASYLSYVGSIYDYGEYIICVVINKGHRKDHVNINNLSSNFDGNISKKKQIATTFIHIMIIKR